MVSSARFRSVISSRSSAVRACRGGWNAPAETAAGGQLAHQIGAIRAGQTQGSGLSYRDGLWKPLRLGEEQLLVRVRDDVTVAVEGRHEAALPDGDGVEDLPDLLHIHLPGDN